MVVWQFGGVLAIVYFPIVLGQVLFFRDPAKWSYPARLLTPESMVVHMVTWQSLGHLVWGGLGMAALLLRLLPDQADGGALAALIAGLALLAVWLHGRKGDTTSG
jgi:hypothetical protein